MKILSHKSGFSLVELLTVIAIIAILAAIIFPVMGTVRDRARQNQCMTNLKQMALSVQAFKTDNRRYPETLGPIAETGKLMEQAKLGTTSLFPAYVNTVKIFHCPNGKVTNTQLTAKYLKRPFGPPPAEPELPTFEAYAYSNYDCYLTTFSPPFDETNTETRYTTFWVPTANENDAVAWLTADDPANLPPDGVENNEASALEDYSRQLKFRNPPGDTVVTWCSNHETTSGVKGSELYSVKGNALVVFLDGHAGIVPANRAETSKWRVRPSKG